MTYAVRQLETSAGGSFAELAERNNLIFGGCWCIGSHPECMQQGINHREVKEHRSTECSFVYPIR